MFHFMSNPRPPDSILDVTPGHENLESIAFFRSLNEHIHRSFPGVVLIAEESTSWPGVTSRIEYLFPFSRSGYTNSVIFSDHRGTVEHKNQEVI